MFAQSARRMSGMAIGVFLPTRLSALGGADDPASFVESAESIEALGFDSVWVGDSLLARPRPEPLTLLAAIAARTRRIAIGTAVLLPALRNPLLLAHAVATLDRLAAGRLVLGVGLGFRYPPTERELAAVGVPMRERTQRVLQAIDLCRQLWSSETPIAIDGPLGRIGDIEIVPRPHRPGGPPIWMGGNENESLRRAGRIADGWLPTSTSPDVFAAGWRIVAETAKAAGRSAEGITPAVMLTVTVDRDPAAAQAELSAWMEAYYSLPFELLRTILGCHAGTADDVAEWIGGFVDAGARHVVLRFASHQQAPQIELAAATLGRWR